MFRSSILNFESLQGFQPRIPATLLAVVALIAALELVVRVWPERSLIPAQSRQGEVFFMEDEVLSKFKAPQIVFLGSSRIRRAIVPKQLDRQLGLPDGSTINLGLAMARVYESLYLYERNQEQLKHAKIVVLNVDEWHLSTGPKMSNTLYETHAPLLERLRFPDEQRTRLFLDGLLNMRLKLRLVPAAILRRKHDKQALKLNDDNQVLPPARAEKLASYNDQIEMFYDKFNVHEVMLSHIERLAELVRANGGKFVLMQLPNRASYQAEVERTHGAEFIREHDALEALVKKMGVPLHFYRAPEELGLSDSMYEDYGHIKPDGAKIVTEKVGAWIAKELAQ